MQAYNFKDTCLLWAKPESPNNMPVFHVQVKLSKLAQTFLQNFMRSSSLCSTFSIKMVFYKIKIFLVQFWVGVKKNSGRKSFGLIVFSLFCRAEIKERETRPARFPGLDPMESSTKKDYFWRKKSQIANIWAKLRWYDASSQQMITVNMALEPILYGLVKGLELTGKKSTLASFAKCGTRCNTLPGA